MALDIPKLLLLTPGECVCTLLLKNIPLKAHHSWFQHKNLTRVKTIRALISEAFKSTSRLKCTVQFMLFKDIGHVEVTFAWCRDLKQH